MDINPIPHSLEPAAPPNIDQTNPAPSIETLNSYQAAEVVAPVSSPIATPQPLVAQPSQGLSSQQSATNVPQQVLAKESAGAGIIVLEWLTYAFWGWTVLALSVLVSTIIATFIGDVSTDGFTPYGIAAVLVLLPISVICDVLFTKHEEVKKTGAAMAVMIIHAVIFALFGIGAIIGAAFSMVQMFTSSGDKTAAQITLFSSIIIAVIYASVFLRTLNPVKFPWIRRAFLIFIAVTVGIICLLGIFGPMANARLTRDDKLLQTNLTSVDTAIKDYVRKNNKLPETLSQLDTQGDVKSIIDRNLVRYTPNSNGTLSKITSTTNTSRVFNDTNSQVLVYNYYYKLCVDYKKKSNDFGATDYSVDNKDTYGYTAYENYFHHDAGESCYKNKAQI